MQARPVVYNEVMDGLKRAPRLRIITIPCKLSGESMLRTLAENRRLKEIRLIQLPSPSRDWPMDYRAQYGQLEPRLRDLIVFQPESLSLDPTDHSTNSLAIGSPNISPSDPRFVPMENVDDNVHDTIWDCIFRHLQGYAPSIFGTTYSYTRFRPSGVQGFPSNSPYCSCVRAYFNVTRDFPFLTSDLSEPTKHGHIRKESTAEFFFARLSPRNAFLRPDFFIR
jgi:hypothetical protein